MSLTAKLLCLADYIEPTRPYERCKALRRQFHRGLSEAETPEARLSLLDSALLCYFEGTVEYILLNPDAEGALDPRTLASRDALLQGGVTPADAMKGVFLWEFHGNSWNSRKKVL